MALRLRVAVPKKPLCRSTLSRRPCRPFYLALRFFRRSVRLLPSLRRGQPAQWLPKYVHRIHHVHNGIARPRTVDRSTGPK